MWTWPASEARGSLWAGPAPSVKPQEAWLSRQCEPCLRVSGTHLHSQWALVVLGLQRGLEEGPRGVEGEESAGHRKMTQGRGCGRGGPALSRFLLACPA